MAISAGEVALEAQLRGVGSIGFFTCVPPLGSFEGEPEVRYLRDDPFWEVGSIVGIGFTLGLQSCLCGP